MHHDDLKESGTVPHWRLDNLIPQGTYGIDDVLSLESALRAPASGTAPSTAAYKTALALYEFPNAANRYLQSTVQLPHSYWNGTELNWHVHFIPTTQIADGETVIWKIELTKAALNATFGALVTYTSTYTSSGATAADTHCKTSLATVPGTGLNGSSFLSGRIYRDVTDTFGGSVLLLGADYHIRKARIGSSSHATTGVME